MLNLSTHDMSASTLATLGWPYQVQLHLEMVVIAIVKLTGRGLSRRDRSLNRGSEPTSRQEFLIASSLVAPVVRYHRVHSLAQSGSNWSPWLPHCPNASPSLAGSSSTTRRSLRSSSPTRSAAASTGASRPASTTQASRRVCRLEDFDWTASIAMDRRLLDAVL